MPTTETIADLAHRLLASDDQPKSGETHRLAAFIVDHAEHLSFDARTQAPPHPAARLDTPLTKRLEPMRPDPQQHEPSTSDQAD